MLDYLFHISIHCYCSFYTRNETTTYIILSFIISREQQTVSTVSKTNIYSKLTILLRVRVCSHRANAEAKVKKIK